MIQATRARFWNRVMGFRRTNHRGTEDTEKKRRKTMSQKNKLVFFFPSSPLVFSVSSVPLWFNPISFSRVLSRRGRGSGPFRSDRGRHLRSVFLPAPLRAAG